MKEFIKVSDAGLGKTVQEGDYKGLVECMGHLLAVREKAETTDGMFEPLRETIELLKVILLGQGLNIKTLTTHNSFSETQIFWCYLIR